jgi:hypothetical protein
MNLSKLFNSSLDKVMRKAAHPLGGMIHKHHAAGGIGGSTNMAVVFVVCLCCVLHLVWLSSLVVCKKVPEHNLKVHI